MTTLWYDSGYEFKVGVLDTFAEFLRNSENYFEKAKEALKCYLKEDNEYIVFHKEELGLDIPDEICEFVEQMKIEAISLWAGENFISVYFMINPEESDQILCVKFNDGLEVESIDWES